MVDWGFEAGQVIFPIEVSCECEGPRFPNWPEQPINEAAQKNGARLTCISRAPITAKKWLHNNGNYHR